MSVLLQEFETPVSDRSGETYRAFLYAHSRPQDTWEGLIVFERQRDGARYSTAVETTQADSQAVLYWATGLTAAYFEGALGRALNRQPEGSADRPAPRQPEPVVQGGDDSAMRRRKLTSLEREILKFIEQRRQPRLLSQVLFDALPHANADIVRALEDLEKRARLVARKTEAGSDWIVLTEAGLRETGLLGIPHDHQETRLDPPKSVT